MSAMSEKSGGITLAAGRPGRRLLSLREAIVLADVCDQEHCIRNDVDGGVFAGTTIRYEVDSHRRYDWISVPVFAAIYGNAFVISDRMFRDAIATKLCVLGAHRLRHMMDRPRPTEIVPIDTYLAIPLGALWSAVKPRIDLYRKGLSRIREEDISRGESVRFRFSGLSVEEAAQLGEDGEDMENILADYLYLTEDDIKFARLYSRACLVMDWPRQGTGARHSARA